MTELSLSILLLVFVICKAIGVTAIAGWSWWWVLSPAWIPFAIIGVILLIILLTAGAMLLYDSAISWFK